MTPKVQAAIAALYDAFADAKRPSCIEVSPVKEPEDFVHLTYVPLRELTEQQLRHYCFSVFYTVGNLSDFEYLFPRIIELVSDVNSDLEREVIFKKLPLAGWPTQWRADRRQAFHAYLDAVLEALKMRAWPVDSFAKDQINSWVCALSFCVDDMDTPLDELLTGTPAADLNLILFYEANSESLLRNRLSNAYWDRQGSMHHRIVTWFQRANVQMRINQIYEARSGSDTGFQHGDL